MAAGRATGYDRATATVPILGHDDGAAIVLDEAASLAVGQAVRVVVIVNSDAAAPTVRRRSLAGFAEGMFGMSDDFDAPLDFCGMRRV